LALNAGWDNELLAIELSDLQDMGYDLSLTGFDEDEIKRLNNIEDTISNEPIDESRNLLLIECIDERELEKLFEEMKTRGLECKILS
jgi:hypothetical protein